MSNMTRAKLSKVGGKSLVCVCIIVLFSTLLIGYTRLQKDVPSDLEKSLRHRRDLLDNDTTVFMSPCTQELVPVNGTVERIVQTINVENDYVSLVRLSINFTDKDFLADGDEPMIWQWGLGGRGRTLLRFPYDNRSLSMNTLSYGMHNVYITFNNSVSQNESLDAPCLSYALSKLLRQVRLNIVNTGGVSNDAMDDTICKEQYLTLPSFRGTLMPGYSLFDLQTSTYFQCWNILNIKTCDQDNCLEYPPYNIYCTLVTAAFWITYGFLFIAIIYELWNIYTRTFNYQDEDFGEYVNILRIHLIPPVLLMLASNKARHHRIFHISYWVLLYASPFIIYFVAFLWYMTRVDEYTQRSARRGGMYTQTNAWGLDFGLANILYIDGAIVFLYYIYKYRLEHKGELVVEQRYDWKTKKNRLFWYSAVALLCFFRFSASAMLIVEIVALTVIGIAINIRFGSPIWINFILMVFVTVANVLQFFDSYQYLFNQIYSVGAKVDRGESPHKLFLQTDDPQLKFRIKSSLLRDIVRKWLPLQIHLFRTLLHIFAALAFLGVIAGIVILIDQTTQVSSFIEYVITAVPLVFAAVGKLGGSSLTAGGRAKNRAQDKLLRLEEDIREYAETGEFPGPEDSLWLFFWNWVSWTCCRKDPYREDPADQEPAKAESSGDPAGSDDQPIDPPPETEPGETTPVLSTTAASSPLDIEAVAGDRTSAAASSLSSPTVQDPASSPSSQVTESHALLGEHDVTKEGGDRSKDVSV